MNQNVFAFARKMEPCDYDSVLANVLPENDCVKIKTYSGKKKARGKEEKVRGKEEEFTK